MATSLRHSMRRIPLLASLVASLVGVALGLWTNNWLSALLIALSILLATLVALLIRVLIQRERQEQLVRGLEGQRRQTPTGVPQASGATPVPAVSLEERFRETLSEMRAHFAGRAGVYELPWFLVLGDVGAGKSVLLQECGLDVPARYARRGFGPTESCEFLLANEAIALDTPGRWFRCVTERDRDEWRSLLELLRRHRPECPINGVIVAIPVPMLLAQSRAELEEHGRELRRRLNELRVDLGIDTPIYLVLTKADALEGFVETVRPLPVDWRQQAFGWTNDQRRLADPEELVGRELQALADRLDGFLPELLLRETDPLRQLRLFAYPQELGALARAIATVAGTAFKRDAYDAEAPFLRGVYLASSRIEGATMSPTLSRLGVHGAVGRRGDTPLRGLFLRDVLLEIARGDENLAVPDSRIGPLGRRALGAAAGLVGLWLVGVWGISFVQNYQGTHELARGAERALVPDPSLADLAQFEQQLAVEERNAASPIQWIGFHRLGHAVESGQRTYTWAFRRSFDALTRGNLERSLDGEDQTAVQSAIAMFTDLDFMARRTQDAVAPKLDPYLPQSVSDPEVYARAYADFVRWLPERDRQELIGAQTAVLTPRVPRLLQLPLLERITSNPEGSIPPVRYSDFGLESPSTSRGVAGIYTQPGYEKLIQVLIAAAERTPDAVSPATVAEFKRQYAELYVSSWRRFLLDTPMRPKARPVKDSPYVALLASIEANTQGDELPGKTPVPDWVEMLRAVRKREASVTDRIPLPGRDEALKALGPPWLAYEKALEPLQLELERAAQGSDQALGMARDMGQGKESSFSIALQVVDRIATLVMAPRSDAEVKVKLQQLLQAPIRDGLSSVLAGAMQELDRAWRQKIVAPYRDDFPPGGVGEYKNSVNGFLEQDLGPFVSNGQPRRLLGGLQLPIGSGALSWINRYPQIAGSLGAGEPGKLIRLAGVPSSIDGAPQLRVTRTDLRFTCPAPEGERTLTYREGSGEMSFTWLPGCLEISLRVSLAGDGADELQPKSWSGSTAVYRFLNDGKDIGGNVFEWRFRGPAQSDVRVKYRVLARPKPPTTIPAPPGSLGS